jgi:hypothetical protein
MDIKDMLLQNIPKIKYKITSIVLDNVRYIKDI